MDPQTPKSIKGFLHTERHSQDEAAVASIKRIQWNPEEPGIHANGSSMTRSLNERLRECEGLIASAGQLSFNASLSKANFFRHGK
jgi:hypothetical protein